MIHCAGLETQQNIEKNIEYKHNEIFENNNICIRHMYTSIANRFDNIYITGDLIRKIFIYFQTYTKVFQFWKDIFDATSQLQQHSSKYVWLVAPVSVCPCCFNNIAFKKLRYAKIVDIDGVWDAIEVVLCCNNKNCTITKKHITYNGWKQDNACGDSTHKYWKNSVTGTNRSRIFARDLQKYVHNTQTNE